MSSTKAVVIVVSMLAYVFGGLATLFYMAYSGIVSYGWNLISVGIWFIPIVIVLAVCIIFDLKEGSE